MLHLFVSGWAVYLLPAGEHFHFIASSVSGFRSTGDERELSPERERERERNGESVGLSIKREKLVRSHSFPISRLLSK